MSKVPAPLVGAAGLTAGVAAATALAGGGWGRARWSREFPYVSDVPVDLLAVFTLTALVTAVAALATGWAFAPRAMRGPRGAVVVAVVVVSAAAQAWNCLYLTALDDPIIPIFVPVEFFLPVLLVGLAASRRARPGGAVALILMAAAPTASLTVLGEGFRTGDPVGSLWFVLFLGAPFAAVGMMLGLVPLLAKAEPLPVAADRA